MAVISSLSCASSGTGTACVASIVRRRCRSQSGSIPHDSDPAHQHPQQSRSSLPALCRQSRLRIDTNTARNARSKTIRSAADRVRRSTKSRCRCLRLGKIEGAAAAAPHIHARARVKIPIARGTTTVLPPAAISCLGAFRPPAASARG